MRFVLVCKKDMHCCSKVWVWGKKGLYSGLNVFDKKTVMFWNITIYIICFLLYFNILSISLMTKLNFQHPFVLICWCLICCFDLIWCFRTIFCGYIFCVNITINILILFKDSLMIRKFKRTAFIWNRFFYNSIPLNQLIIGLSMNHNDNKHLQA